MTLTIAKAVYVLLAVGWYIIRIPHERRSRRTPISRSARGVREIVLLSISFTGLGLLPFIYVATGFPRFANYQFQPVLPGSARLSRRRLSSCSTSRIGRSAATGRCPWICGRAIAW